MQPVPRTQTRLLRETREAAPAHAPPDAEAERAALLATGALGVALMGEPETVLLCACYWQAQYADPRLAPDALLGAHVRALCESAPRLSLAIAEPGLAHTHALYQKRLLLVRFAGSALHALPCEYLVRHACGAVLEALSALLERGARAFDARDCGGLWGELALGEFRYDAELARFYDPALTVTSALLVHLLALERLCGAEPGAALPALARAATACDPRALSLCAAPPGDEARARAHLGALHAALADADGVARAKEAVLAQWSAQAREATDAAPARLEALLARVYGKTRETT